MRRAFTLIEVNLAMMIMAGGILSIVGLYAFGFRESSQSREDVSGAALADAVMGPLIAAISAMDNDWNTFKGAWTYPSQGWAAYMDGNYTVSSDPNSTAMAAFGSAIGKCSGSSDAKQSFPSDAQSRSGLSCALVVRHEKGSGVVSIAFRAVDKNRPNILMSQPLYYTEARFQGNNASANHNNPNIGNIR